MPETLTTTSYAILGQLALRPWHAYELTKEMQRNLHYFWPRAESRIYDEIKRLERAGLATGTASFTGRRRRMTYAITTAGRASLRAWLDQQPGDGIALESEGLLRVLGATAPEHVRAAVEAMRASAEEMLAKAEAIGHEYLEGRAPFQQRVRWRAPVHDFLANYALLIEAWAQRTEQMLDRWELEGEDEIDREALALIADVVGRLEAVRPRASVGE